MLRDDAFILGGLAVLVYYLYKNPPSAFDPTSRDNLAYKAANAATAAITGDPNQTYGGAWFDILNPNAGLAPGETSGGRGIINSPSPAPNALFGGGPIYDAMGNVTGYS